MQKYHEKFQRALKYLKLTKKEYNEAVSMFAMSERKRATTCTEGNMTDLLKNTILYYLSKHPCKELEEELNSRNKSRVVCKHCDPRLRNFSAIFAALCAGK